VGSYDLTERPEERNREVLREQAEKCGGGFRGVRYTLNHHPDPAAHLTWPNQPPGDLITGALAAGAKTTRGISANAKFAQKTHGEAFSDKGSEVLTKLAGKDIRTIDDMVAVLKSGAVDPSKVPVFYVVRNGEPLILNTRTAVALERAGIPRSQWQSFDATGDTTLEALVTGQLARNKLTSGVTSVSSTGH
jgi:hypothetical protein